MLGVELGRRVRSMQGTGVVPESLIVIMVSGDIVYLENQQLSSGKNQLFDDCLRKPFSFDQLKASLVKLNIIHE